MPFPTKKERNQIILALRKKGYSYGKIARIFGIDRTTVAKVCYRDQGKTVDNPALHETEVADIVDAVGSSLQLNGSPLKSDE